MARCRPTFPSFDSLPPAGPSLPSSLSTSLDTGRNISYIEQLAQANARLETLPEELCPPSRTPSPDFGARSQLLRDKVTAAVSHSGHSTLDSRWGHVTNLLRMACTSRRYCGSSPGVRVGERVNVELGSYEYVLPDTAEEWEELEKKWERRLLKVPVNGGQSSKYWLTDPVANTEPFDILGEERTPSKAELVRDKVMAWQAKVLSVSEEAEMSEVESIVAAPAKGKERETAPKQKQSPIMFPVVKPSVLAPKKRSMNGKKPRADSIKDKPPTASTSSNRQHAPPTPSTKGKDVVQEKQSEGSREPHQVPEPHAAAIGDVSEMSFIPPSFPPQLETSTPPVDKTKIPPKVRAKPAPILPLKQSSPILPTSSLNRLAPPLLKSSSLTTVTPSPVRPQKRNRPTVLPPPGEALKALEEPPLKKANTRTSPEHNRGGFPERQKTPEQSELPETITNLVLGPSTPPPLISTPPKTPPTRIQRGLGNAKGLPVPSTPNKLPTLTELLASSRRSRPRPRPPSRKAKSTAVTPAAKPREPDAAEDELPALNNLAAEERPAREASPARTAVSRGKTIFSSPASGSSDSPKSARERPRSPVSPLFSGGRFAPPFVSTQNGNGDGGGGFGGMGASQAPGPALQRGSSGLFGMGYSSQFDLEGQVGMVSDLLERDVDFDGWLRDIPEVDAES